MRRKTDTSNKMLMINTIFFGIGAGLVMYQWTIISSHDDGSFSQVTNNWLDHHNLLMTTAAILFGGLFHSLMILFPQQQRHEEKQIQANLKVSELRDQAMADPLTGIHNRRYFEDALKIYLEEFRVHKATFGLLLLDLDHFKQINDTYGHDVGDQVLKEVANCLLSSSREHDVVARIGGEEFALIVPYNEKSQLFEIAERYRKLISMLIFSHISQNLKLTASVGVATNNEATEPEDIFKAADIRLYEAKNSGRNQVAA